MNGNEISKLFLLLHKTALSFSSLSPLCCSVYDRKFSFFFFKCLSSICNGKNVFAFLDSVLLIFFSDFFKNVKLIVVKMSEFEKNLIKFQKLLTHKSLNLKSDTSFYNITFPTTLNIFTSTQKIISKYFIKLFTIMRHYYLNETQN